MPYNTRRKSLSLSELGIQVPKRARAQSHLLPIPSKDSDEPPVKKARCSHSPPLGNMSPPRTTVIRIKAEPVIKTEPTSNTIRGAEHTPPPSPGASGVSKVDTEGIKDDIVVGVIHQLEETGNRPHTSKELAAVLANRVPTIDTSTNPNALIQARLATYLKGPWPIVSPCPLGKQQENVHPRRVFYHLTTQPHQPIPENSQPVPNARRVISPSLSSNADEDNEDKFSRSRAQLSPSPEVDLSSPELDDETDAEAASTFSGRHSLSRDHSSTSLNLSHNRRAASPPLEREERDFKQTANELQEQRRNSQQKPTEITEVVMKTEDHDESQSIDMTLETAEEPEEVVASQLFGGHSQLAVSGAYDLSSPVLRPQHAAMQVGGLRSGLLERNHTTNKTMDTMMTDIMSDDPMDLLSAWDESGHLRSPENIELDELECLLDAY